MLNLVVFCVALTIVTVYAETTQESTPTPPKMDYDYIRESLMDKKFKAIWDEELRWGLSSFIDEMKAKGPTYFIKDPSYYNGESGEARWDSLRRYIKAIGPKGFYEGFMHNIGLSFK
uniref:Uncharacterized protein n=1 Tax=Cacopsylla melanoneura TaxID=428564 RepID=A0A8D8WDE2_9HEMI